MAERVLRKALLPVAGLQPWKRQMRASSQPVRMHGAILLLSLNIALSCLTGCRGESPASGPKDAYDYPVKPGTPAWQAFTTHEQMLSACQVPENILRTMSTRGLVETALAYPLFGDMRAYLDLQHGFDIVVANSNALAELLTRQDAGSELLSRYQSMDPLAVDPTWTSVQRGQYDAEFLYIEMLLAQPSVLATLTYQERRDLLAQALDTLEGKQQRQDLYGHLGQERTGLVMARLLQFENDVSFLDKIRHDPALQDFIQTSTLAPDPSLQAIVTSAREFLHR